MGLKCIRPPSIKQERVKEVHVFDLDKTLTLSNSSLLFVKFLKEEGLVSLNTWLGCVWGYLLYRLRLVSMEKQIRSSFKRFFEGRSIASIEACLPVFWERQLSKLMREDLVEHLVNAQKKGHVIAIYSASSDFLVEWIARKMCVHFVLASECLVNRSQQTFLDLGVIANGPVKAAAVRKLRYRYPKAIFYGYSDSIDDAPFLEAVDCPCLVSPDPQLQIWAKGKSHVVVW